MNRKDRRAMESADRRAAKAIGGLHAKMDRLVLDRVKAYHSGNEEVSEDGLFDLVVSEGFDESLDRTIGVFMNDHPDFNVIGLKSELLEEAASCAIATQIGDLDDDMALELVYGSIFAIPMSGHLGDISDAWSDGSLQIAINEACTKLTLGSSEFIVMPVPLDLVDASVLMPGAVSRLLRMVTESVVYEHGVTLEEVQEILGVSTDFGTDRNAFGGRLVLVVELQKGMEDQEIPIPVLYRDEDEVSELWDKISKSQFPEGIATIAPSDLTESMVSLALLRIELALKSEAKIRGIPETQFFDRIELSLDNEMLWVSAFVDDIALGPINCPRLIAHMDFEYFHYYLSDIAHSVTLNGNVEVGWQAIN